MTLADDGAGTESRTVTWAYDKARQQAPQQRWGGERGRGERRQGRHGGVRSWRKVLGTGLQQRDELRRCGGLGVGAAALARAWLGHGGIRRKGYGGSVK